jgi:hypothetical protein
MRGKTPNRPRRALCRAHHSSFIFSHYFDNITMNRTHRSRTLFWLVVLVVASTVGTLTSAFVSGPRQSAASFTSSSIVRHAESSSSSSHRYDYDRMYSPRNDVYFYRPEDVMMQNANRRQAPSMQDPDYRPPTVQRSTNPAMFNPRNDVFPRQPEAHSAELLVEKELAKIQAKGRYAIENELYNVHGIAIQRDFHSRDELACLLLKARLGGSVSGNRVYPNNNGRNFRTNDNLRNDNQGQQQQQQLSYYSVAANHQNQPSPEPVRMNGLS